MDAGYMTKEELRLFDTLSTGLNYHIHNFWIPWQWTCTLAYMCRKEGRVDSDAILCKIFDAIVNYRDNLSQLVEYDWISVPLVYTQVVTIAVYSYFVASLMGRQYLDPKKNYKGYEIDLYFPFITVVEFFFYMGWLKVAESIINPLGTDDEDFDTLKIIDRNFEVLFEELHLRSFPVINIFKHANLSSSCFSKTCSKHFVANVIVDQNSMRMPVLKEKFYDLVSDTALNLSELSEEMLKSCSVTNEILIKYDGSGIKVKCESNEVKSADSPHEKEPVEEADEEPDSVMIMEHKDSVKL
ncbi:unnamed protein product [Soboliphyme baturini]|uniref:Bestrophin homolog n=1 Tax=Soboliphyme baturini TaxID=241478 RepID=A0A183J6Q8_9BILA|nr:unnamed protein product [Soboliphyme baturini]